MYHQHTNWVEFIFIVSQSRRWRFTTCCRTTKRWSRRMNGKLAEAEDVVALITRMMISGELRSAPPASLMPHASPADRRLRVTPNSWYNWLIVSALNSLSAKLIQRNQLKIDSLAIERGFDSLLSLHNFPRAHFSFNSLVYELIQTIASNLRLRLKKQNQIISANQSRTRFRLSERLFGTERRKTNFGCRAEGKTFSSAFLLRSCRAKMFFFLFFCSMFVTSSIGLRNLSRYCAQ